jgi:hypothetical protein
MVAFRFGYQVGSCDADALRANAVAAEAAGFDVIHTWDHVGDTKARAHRSTKFSAK